jgi:hypothetical protein
MRDSGDDDDTMRKVGIGLAVLAVGAAAYYGGRNSSGGGYAPTPPTDYDWAWDLQRGGAGGLVWVCRGIQSGQYSDQSHCAYKIQSDSQWPGY